MPRKVPLNEFGLPTPEYFQHLKKSTRLKYLRRAQREANMKIEALEAFLSFNPKYNSRILSNYKEKYNVPENKEFRFRTPHSFLEKENPKKGVVGEMAARYSDVLNFLRAKTSTGEGLINEAQSKADLVNSAIDNVADEIEYRSGYKKERLEDNYDKWSNDKQSDFWRAFEIFKAHFSGMYNNKTDADEFLQATYAIFSTTPNLLDFKKGEYSPSSEFLDKMNRMNENPYSYRQFYNDIEGTLEDKKDDRQ